MICPHCKNEIESDSYYCDQCGEEQFLCEKCGRPGKGKRCTQDGALIISAKEYHEKSNGQAPSAPSSPPTQSPTIPKTETPPPTQQVQPHQAPPEPTPQPISQTGVSDCVLSNKALNANLKMENGDIIGRKKGRFVNIFGSYKQVSGKHAQIDYIPSEGWFVKDLGSSNGTKYQGKALEPMQQQKLEDKSFLLIANIEFFVQITGDELDDDDKTIRI